jgi:hypothetical protein
MNRFLFGCAALALTTSAAYAQETTSSIRGDVSSNGAPVTNATVRVVHVPSGTAATTVTGNDGTFSLSGLRPGGPFTITVIAEGVGEASLSDIQLTAGQPLRLPISLDGEMQDIVVSGTRKAVDMSGGPITSMDRGRIETVATINRDIRDLTRRDPFVTVDQANSRAVNIAGQNGRLNKFSVDGVRFSDSFGLNEGGLPTTRGPVPLDAIEQVAVKVAPFDITEGDFQGGAINVILRSGGNEFTGSAFYTYSGDKLTGDKSDGVNVKLDFDSRNYGGFLSGPLIKDRLFFAASYEYLKQTSPVEAGLAGFSNVIPNITQGQVDAVSGIASSLYGYDTLGIGTNSAEKDEKYTLKLDWNVTDGHRLSASYIHNEGSQMLPTGANTSTSTPSLGLLSSFYTLGERVDSGIVSLNSDWSSDFSTEVRVNYRDTKRSQDPVGGRSLGSFNVCLDPTSNATPITCSAGTGRLSFGADQFRHSNALRYKNYGADITLRLTAGDHSFKGYGAYSHFDVYNLFLPASLGNYYFDSIADLQAGRAQQLVLRSSVTGDEDDAAARYKTDNFVFALQDAWDINPALNVTFGARFDLMASPSTQTFNPFYIARYGFSNQQTFDGQGIFQPRLGFTYRPVDRLTLRGSAGKYGGGTPEVFLSNSFSNTGVASNVVTFTRNADGSCNVSTSLCNAALTNVQGGIPQTVYGYVQANTGALSMAATNTLAPGIKPASSWKASLSAEYALDMGNLGSDWIIGADLLYSKVENAFTYSDLRSVAIGTMPDGRPRYGPLNGIATNNQDMLLTNTDKGRSIVAVVHVDKQIGDVHANVSYTFQDIKDFNPIIGTTVSGSYSGQATIDPNGSDYGTSIYEVRNSVKLALDYEHKFFGDMATRLNLFGEWRSGRPYSLTMYDNVAGTAARNIFGVTSSNPNMLLYVPNVSNGMTGDALVTYDSQATFDAVSALVTDRGLKQGAIAKKNTERSPNFLKIDLHAEQEVPVFVGSSRIKLFADMENVLNFIDSDWSALKQVNSPYLANVVNVACSQMSGSNCTQYRYSSFAKPAVNNQTRYSLWGVRIGAKFSF